MGGVVGQFLLLRSRRRSMQEGVYFTLLGIHLTDKEYKEFTC